MRPHLTSSWGARRVAQWLRQGAVVAVLISSALLPIPTLVYTATTAQAQEPNVYPAANWEPVLLPESVGYSSAGLENVRAQLATMDTDAMMVVVGGRVLFEYGNTATVSYLASVRKSVLSMLYGIYVGNGTVNLDKTLEQLGINDHGGLTQAERQATTRHLLMARSGVYHAASNTGDDLAYAPPRGSQPPETYFLYSNWDFNAAGAIFERETGIDIYDALQWSLAVPLGFQDFDRSTHRKSGDLSLSMYPAYHMNLSTRDMARIGYLMLRNGNWNGTQIIPAAWVQESTSPLTRRTEINPQPRTTPWGYGYLWWVYDSPELPPEFNGAYIGQGAYGQYILVMPALDMVIVHKTVPAESGQPSKDVSSLAFAGIRQLVLAARCGQSGVICNGEGEEDDALDEGTIKAVAAAQVLEGVRAFDGSSTTAKFFAGATADRGATTSTIFSENDEVVIAGAVAPQIQDVGQAANVFIVVYTIIDGESTWVYRNLDGNFERWSTRVSELKPAYEIESLEMLEAFVVYSGTLQEASHRIFIGYMLRDGSGPLHYNEIGVSIEVE